MVISDFVSKPSPRVMRDDILTNHVKKTLAKQEGLCSIEFNRLCQDSDIKNCIIPLLSFNDTNYINVGNFWKFQHLTKLDLAHNLIDEIRGLKDLKCLEYLNLSFNYIKHIKNLEDLSNLKYLNLSYNEITTLENMEQLAKLETFLVRNNKISVFDNMYSLCRFPNLLCLGVADNPFTEKNKNFRLSILCLMPQLKFLDFKVVTQSEVKVALSSYPSSPQKNSAWVSNPVLTDRDVSSLYSSKSSDQEAFVDSLANGQGFVAILQCDRNFRLLHSFDPASSVANEHRSSMSVLFDKWHTIGHKYYELMKNERTEFLKSIEKAGDFILMSLQDEEQKYISLKEEFPKQLCLIYQRHASFDVRRKNIEELKNISLETLNNTHEKLLNISSHIIDHFYDLKVTFEKEISSITQLYSEEIKELYKTLVQTNRDYIFKLQDFYHHFCEDPNAKENSSFENTDQVLIKLLSRKDFVSTALEMAISRHSSLLKERILRLHNFFAQYQSNTVDSIFEEILVKQNEQIRDILLFSNKQKYVLEDLFNKESVIRFQLGYP